MKCSDGDGDDDGDDNNKIKGLGDFPEELCSVLSKYKDVFDTSIKKTMNVPDSQLNLKDNYRPMRCYTCRPTPLHYMETADKLIAELIAQWVLEKSGDTRTE